MIEGAVFSYGDVRNTASAGYHIKDCSFCKLNRNETHIMFIFSTNGAGMLTKKIAIAEIVQPKELEVGFLRYSTDKSLFELYFSQKIIFRVPGYRVASHLELPGSFWRYNRRKSSALMC